MGLRLGLLKLFRLEEFNIFLNRCIRCILGMSSQVQWREHFTSGKLALKIGMAEGANALLALRRLRWLGHVGRLTDDCLPK